MPTNRTTADFPVELEPETETALIHADQTRLLYAGMPTAMAVTLVVAALLVSIQWPTVDRWKSIAWLCSLGSITLLQGWLWHAFRRAAPDPKESATWRRRFIAGVCLAGAAWGTASILLFPEGRIEHQVFLSFAIGGIAVGAVTTLSPVWVAALSFFTLSLTPLAVRFFMAGTPMAMAMGAMVLVFLAAVISNARRIHNHTEQSIRLRTVAISREEELRIAAAAFESRDAMIITDGEGNILRTNQAFSRITGYEQAETFGRNPRILKSGRHDDAFYRALWNSLLETGHWEGEIWNRRKNGQIYPEWLVISAVQNKASGNTHYVAHFQDLTHRKQAEKNLQEKTAYLDSILHSTPNLAIVATDLDFHITYYNHVAEQIFHHAASDVLGKTVMELHAREQRDSLWFERAIKIIRRKGEYHYTTEQKWNGETHHIDSRLSCIENREGDLIGYIQLSEDVTERRRATEMIEYMAYFDGLTGLPNRRQLVESLDQALARCERHNHLGALLFLDLDHFKTINDSLGHPVGDLLLQQVSERLHDVLRREDTAARLGGDEFVVLLSEMNDDPNRMIDQAQSVAKKIQSALSARYLIGEHELHITTSIGISPFPLGERGADDILRHADAAMYRAKGSGRNAIRLYHPNMQTAADELLALGKDLRKALERDEFSLAFQPQVDTSGRIFGAEALLRWDHPEHGSIAPGNFISLAEEIGMILPIGEWVLKHACMQIRAWMETGYTNIVPHLAINISPHQFKQASFIGQVHHVLEETGADPAHLIMELTESVMIDDAMDTIDKMQSLKTLGIGFSIDDFGTGYSSLSYLKRLPLDILKIDRSFIRDVNSDPNSAAIVETIISMARHLKLMAIAEGVEKENQLAFLKANGCERYQGYYFSRPLPLGEFEDLIQSSAESA